jgi:hypothetical protein
MMTLYEFTVFGLYLFMLLVFMVTIQVTNPGKQIRETLHGEYKESIPHDDDDVSDAEEEQEKAPFNPEEEPYKMTENPMFSHQDSMESTKED